MKYLWSESFDTDSCSIWPINYQGLFIKNNEVQFYYLAHDGLVRLQIDEYGIKNRDWLANRNTICLPQEWSVLYVSGKKMIDFNNGMLFEIANKQFISENTINIDDKIGKAKEKIDPNDKVFVFGDYKIMPYKNAGIQCIFENTKLWNKKIQGYRYTDIYILGESIIYFGTDGAGGKLYSLCLNSGEVISEISTGGTNEISTNGSIAYVVKRGKKAKVLSVDLKYGHIISEVEIPGMANTASRLFVDTDKIYVITFLKRATGDLCPTVSCLQI